MKGFCSVIIGIVAFFAFAGPGLTQVRFSVLSQFNNAAVLDNKTGLVWERSPSKSTFNWHNAQTHCNNLTVGTRSGWRLPTLEELKSLVDERQENPPLAPGHPFSNVQSSLYGSFYWSATTDASNSSLAWGVVFLFSGGVTSGIKSFDNFVWCARGGQ